MRKPIVIVQTIQRRTEVVDLSSVAADSGVRRSMSLAESRALCPGLISLDHDAKADRRALEALGRWMTRFTPVVATGWPDETVSRHALLILDLTGCERLFGSLTRVARLAFSALVRFHVPARLAIAPTSRSAWAFAWAGSKPFYRVEAGELPQAVKGLPVESLQLDVQIISDLRQLGLHTIGQLLALPRDMLPSRFGLMLTTRLDQFMGVLPDLLTPLAYEVPIESRMDFDEPINSQEMLLLILEELTRRVMVDLTRRGHGARRIEIECTPDQSGRYPVITKIVPLSSPTRNVKSLSRLMRLATDKMNCHCGFVRIALKVPLHEPVQDEQILLHEEETHSDRMELDHLVERLCVRLGDGAIVRPELVESYLPERAWRSSSGTEAVKASSVTRFSSRPVCLLATPVEVRVTVEPTDDLVGRPAQFICREQVYRLVNVIGPERIAGEWWRGHLKTRDYYDVHDQEGRRFWIFRVIAPIDPERVSIRWFLHGLFQ